MKTGIEAAQGPEAARNRGLRYDRYLQVRRQRGTIRTNFNLNCETDMSVGQFCNRETVVIRKDESITDAAKLMRQYHVGSVIVVEDAEGGVKPAGIVTDRDLVVEILAAELDPAVVAIGDIMSFELITARENDGIWDTLQRMRAKGVRRVPVVSDAGLLVGILTSDDVLEVLAGELVDLARIVNREAEREQHVRGNLS